MKINNQSRYILLSLMVFVPAAMRVIDHPWNLASVGAIALFAGAQFREKTWAFVLPISAMFFSDVAMGYLRNDWSYAFHQLMPVIYGCYAINVLLGMGVRWSWTRSAKQSANHELDESAAHTDNQQTSRITFVQQYVPVALAALTGSVLFFFITNFAVWLVFPTYSQTVAGLVQCYVLALPYFRSTLASDFVCATVLFVGFDLLRDRLPVFAESRLMQSGRI